MKWHTVLVPVLAALCAGLVAAGILPAGVCHADRYVPPPAAAAGAAARL